MKDEVQGVIDEMLHTQRDKRDYVDVDGFTVESWADRLTAALRQQQDAPSPASTAGREAVAWPDPVVRFNDDGSLDEVVGVGEYHLEQMDSGHWWMQLGPHHVNLSAKRSIKAIFSANEAHGNDRFLFSPIDLSRLRGLAKGWKTRAEKLRGASKNVAAIAVAELLNELASELLAVIDEREG